MQLVTLLQIFSALVFMALAILQSQGKGLSPTVFGGGESFYGARRGVEKLAFGATIFFALLFLLLSFIAALG